MFSQAELDKASEILKKSGFKDMTVEQVAAIMRAYEVINREHVITPFTLENEHGKLHCNDNGYIEIDRYDHARQSGFAPEWVTDIVQSYHQPDSFDSEFEKQVKRNRLYQDSPDYQPVSFEFDTFQIPCEDNEGNESEPLEVASDGVIGIGAACFEVGLPIVYSLYCRSGGVLRGNAGEVAK